jgi:DNA mismatch repair protein MutS
MQDLTPMMRQYQAIKNQHQDAILFFRLGDFYEMFFDDAKLASKELEITLTGRPTGAGRKIKIPMCGIPYHAATGYISRLLNRGYKVAICEQIEDPALAAGLTKREVIKIITPGTLTESELIPDKKNNFLAALVAGENGYGLAYCDISTGVFRITEFAKGAKSS